jgi:hypothetical protein
MDLEIGQVYNIILGKKDKIIKRMVLINQDKNADLFFLDEMNVIFNKSWMYETGTKISIEKILELIPGNTYINQYKEEYNKREKQKELIRKEFKCQN